MSTEQPHNHNDSVRFAETTSASNQSLAGHLIEAGISLERGIDMATGAKCPAKGTKWRNGELPPITNTEGQYGVRCGDGLLVFDVDDWSLLPDEVKAFLQNNPTLVVRTPHSDDNEGHYYFATDCDVNVSIPGAEIQGEGALVVGPGSEIWGIRDGKDCKIGCCTRDSPGIYTIDEHPIAVLEGQLPESILQNSGDTDAESPTAGMAYEPPELLDVQRVAEYERYLCQEFTHQATSQAVSDVMDLLKGGTGSITGLRHYDGSIDRDKADLEALWLLYGVYLQSPEYSDKAREAAREVYTKYCDEHPYVRDSTGRRRKWLRDPQYRRNRTNRAAQRFEHVGPGPWFRWLRRKGDTDFNPYSPPNWARQGQRSKLTIEITLIASHLLAGGPIDEPQLTALSYMFHVDLSALITLYHTPHGHKVLTPPVVGKHGEKTTRRRRDYPTAKEIAFLARIIDEGARQISTYQQTARELQSKHGMLKCAYVPCYRNGERYVYYPPTYPDPDIADWVRCGGEENET